jgi:hypothetical protein
MTNKNEVSNPWLMDKDGMAWRSVDDMNSYAERIASYKAKGNKNLALKLKALKLKARILAKCKAK